MQLIQVLQYLLGDGGRLGGAAPAVHVSAVRDGAMQRFSVRDNGPGIAEEYREKVFEPFKRLAGNGGEGLGLGLAICRKIVESCGGSIRCEAALPQGTSFIFTFPCAEAVAGKVAAPAPAAVDGDSWAGGGELAGILVVEDNEADIELTRFALLEEQRLRCSLHVARGGREALARFEGRAAEALCSIDLILLDINMPGMDGFEFLSRLRGMKETRALPVVMCTTSTYDKDMEQAKALGAAGYIVKPLDFGRLRPILESAPGLALHEADGMCSLTRKAG
jgi:CheY-like chemotaxis protein